MWVNTDKMDVIEVSQSVVLFEPPTGTVEMVRSNRTPAPAPATKPKAKPFLQEFLFTLTTSRFLMPKLRSIGTLCKLRYLRIADARGRCSCCHFGLTPDARCICKGIGAYDMILPSPVIDPVHGASASTSSTFSCHSGEIAVKRGSPVAILSSTTAFAERPCSS